MKVVPFVIALAACGAAAQAPPQDPRVPCRVARVIDGDTFTCTGGRRVRLLLIDAPEGRQRPYGDSATANLQRLVRRGTALSLELGRDSTDRYGRTLAFAWLPDGRMVNEELVRRGWAVVYLYDRKNLHHAERLQVVEDSARIRRRGLWRDGSIRCRPDAFRRGECSAAS
jgi:micrococcal nuclease